MSAIEQILPFKTFLERAVCEKAKRKAQMLSSLSKMADKCTSTKSIKVILGDKEHITWVPLRGRGRAFSPSAEAVFPYFDEFAGLIIITLNFGTARPLQIV